MFDDEGLAGIRVKWGFDEMFSSMIAGDYDQNHNGKLEKPEIALIKKEAFSYLADHDYFCFIRIDEKPFKVKYVREFSAFLNEGKLSYEFFIPCHVKSGKAFRKIAMSLYDPTYYTAVFFAENQPVSIESGSGFEISSTIAKNQETSYYYDMLHPWELILNFRLKNE